MVMGTTTATVWCFAMMYSHKPKGYVCPFCLVVEGVENEDVLTLQSHIIFQNERVTAFVSSHQFTERGMNVLVVPNEHYENIYALPSSYGCDLQQAKRLVALALKRVYACEGVSSRQHNEPAGFQDVWHYHEHLTPRFEGDDLYTKMQTSKVFVPVALRTDHASRLREAVAHLSRAS